MGPVRCPYGGSTGPAQESPMFLIFYGTRAGPARHLYGQVRELTLPEFAKIPHGRRMWPYGARAGPLRSPHGLFTGYLRSLNPYGDRKLIMHALKRQGHECGGTGLVRAPWVDVRFLFKTAREQPDNSPYGRGVWCDWSISGAMKRGLTAPSHYLNQCWLIIDEVPDDIHPRTIFS